MPPAGRKQSNVAQDDNGMTPAHPEYVAGYQMGHRDGQEIGYADGKAASIGDDTKELIEAAEARGYQRGRDAERIAKRPPLFEAAKRFCESGFEAPDDVVEDALAELEETYAERLSRSDRGLLLGIVKRRRQAAEAQRQALLTVNRPKSQAGREVASLIAGPTAAGSDSRAETIYTTVR